MSFEQKREVVIYRKNYRDVKFNTRILNPDNCRLIVVHNGAIKRLNRLENNILNPHKKTIFSNRKIDKNEYTVFRVKENYFDGTWGGNVQYIDTRFSNIQEKVFIQAVYSYQIFCAEKAVQLISDCYDEYDNKYVNMKINLKIDNIIKNSIVKRLNSIGFIETQNEITSISKSAEDIINETALSMFGIFITNLNILLEESDDHYSFRKEYEWNQIK